ncbi:MAG: hypothetical protein WA890_28040 [Micromonospora sp.]
MTAIALSLLRAGPVQATVLGLLLVALIARIVLQLTGGPVRRNLLRGLDLAAAPLLVAFVIIVVERFVRLS